MLILKLGSSDRVVISALFLSFNDNLDKAWFYQ
jgi:hypothetical protein